MARSGARPSGRDVLTLGASSSANGGARRLARGRRRSGEPGRADGERDAVVVGWRIRRGGEPSRIRSGAQEWRSGGDASPGGVRERAAESSGKGGGGRVGDADGGAGGVATRTTGDGETHRAPRGRVLFRAAVRQQRRAHGGEGRRGRVGRQEKIAKARRKSRSLNLVSFDVRGGIHVRDSLRIASSPSESRRRYPRVPRRRFARYGGKNCMVRDALRDVHARAPPRHPGTASGSSVRGNALARVVSASSPTSLVSVSVSLYPPRDFLLLEAAPPRLIVPRLVSPLLTSSKVFPGGGDGGDSERVRGRGAERADASLVRETPAAAAVADSAALAAARSAGPPQPPRACALALCRDAGFPRRPTRRSWRT